MNYIEPTVSVIIPCFNGIGRVEECLDSIRMQDYPQNKIEYIIVDDDSSDNTVSICRDRYNCKIVTNGTHNIERGKSIGVENASGEYVFLIDDDNRLPEKTWLSTLVKAVVCENAVGGQAAYFHYDKNDSHANRYAALFGINDPAVFYLHNRDKLMQTETSWTLPGTVIKETDSYYKIRFSPENLLTVGSQGFLIKREYILKANWQPYLYHMDTNLELVQQGYNTYIMLKTSVIHNHSNDVKHFINKLKRNIRLYYSENQYRKYTYTMTAGKAITLGLILGTFIIPLIDSIKGFCKIRDCAWFLHPIISFRIAVIYACATLRHLFKRKK